MRHRPLPSTHLGDERAALDTMLVALVAEKGSDLHLTVGAPPTVRVHGLLRPLPDYEPLSPAHTAMLLRAAVNDQQWARFERDHELDFAYSIDRLSRFRVNMYCQRGSFGAAFRTIPDRILPLDQLGVPDQVTRFAALPRGLVPLL